MFSKIQITAVEQLPQGVKILIVMAGDVVISFVATWLAFTLRIDNLHLPNSNQAFTYAIAAAGSCTVFWLMGIYNVIFRYVSIATVKHIAKAALVYGLILFGLLILTSASIDFG